MINIFLHKRQMRMLFSRLIPIAFLGIIIFQVEAIPPKPIASKRAYIPLEKAAFEYEIKNSELQFLEDVSLRPSFPHSTSSNLNAMDLDFDIQQDLKSSAYLLENSFFESRFDFLLNRIFDTSAFLRDFLKSSTPSYSRYFHFPKNDGTWKILFTSLAAVSQSRKDTTFSPNLSKATCSNFLSSFRSFVFFQVNRISQPERAITERKRSRYLALLFSYPPQF